MPSIIPLQNSVLSVVAPPPQDPPPIVIAWNVGDASESHPARAHITHSRSQSSSLLCMFASREIACSQATRERKALGKLVLDWFFSKAIISKLWSLKFSPQVFLAQSRLSFQQCIEYIYIHNITPMKPYQYTRKDFSRCTLTEALCKA